MIVAYIETHTGQQSKLGEEEEGGGDNGRATTTISRKVLEAYTRDLGRAVARIDYDTMDALGVSTGEILQITGAHKSTVARCMPLYPSDEHKEIIRIDQTCRNNAGITIGDTVTLRKVESVLAEKVVVVPLDTLPPIDERYLAVC